MGHGDAFISRLRSEIPETRERSAPQLAKRDRPGPVPDLDEHERTQHARLLEIAFSGLEPEPAREMVDHLWSAPDRRHAYHQRLDFYMHSSEANRRAEEKCSAVGVLAPLIAAGKTDDEYLCLKLRAAIQRAGSRDDVVEAYQTGMVAALMGCVLENYELGYVDDAGEIHWQIPE